MPEKWLCVVAFVVAAILVAVGVLDLAIGMPFGQASMIQDLIFAVAGGLLGWQAYEVWRKVA